MTKAESAPHEIDGCNSTRDRCPSCGLERTGRFCSACGERRVDPSEFRIQHFLRQIGSGLTSFDGRVLGSLRRLLIAPGLLTRDWMRGARVRSLPPFQLFLFVNVAVVVIAGYFDVPSWGSSSVAHDVEQWSEELRQQAARMGLTQEQHALMYNSRASGIARATVVWTIALAGTLSWLLNPRRERRVGVHLVFGTHLVAFFLVVPDLLVSGCLDPFLRDLAQAADSGSGALWVWVRLGAPLVPLLLWWFFASRRVFGNTAVGALWRALLGSLLFYFVGLLAHHILVFRLTLAALE